MMNTKTITNTTPTAPKTTTFAGKTAEEWVNDVKSKEQLHNALKGIELQVQKGNLVWIPLGNRENNLGSINQTRKPETGLIENISNGMDAVIQLFIDQGFGEDEKGRPFTSPQQVIDTYLKSKNYTGGFREFISLISSTNKPLVSVTFQGQDEYESISSFESRQSVTLDIRDRGCGIPWNRLTDTILQLQSGSKTHDPRFIGKYGQGGSTALAHVSHEGATMIATSHHKTPDTMSLTFIKRVDVEGSRNQTFVYLADADTNHPPVLSVKKNTLEHGTLVRHFGYELDPRDQNFAKQARQIKTSLYTTLSELLVDPYLPIRIYDARDTRVRDRVKTSGEVITGSLPRIRQGLNKRTSNQVEDDIVYLSHEISLDLSKGGKDLGVVTLQYAVAGYRKDSTGTSHHIYNFVNGGENGKFYLSGSAIQGFRTQSLRDPKSVFPFLHKYLLVYVKLDTLSDKTLGTVVQGNRESILEEFEKVCSEKVVEYLVQDEQLHFWNDVRSSQGTSVEGSEGVSERLIKEFGNIFKGTKVSNPAIPKTYQSRTVIETGVEEYNFPPTRWETAMKTEKYVYAGNNFGISFITDMDPNLMAVTEINPLDVSSRVNTFWEVSCNNPMIDTSKVRYNGTGGSVKGLGSFTGFQVSDKVQPGDEFHVDISFIQNRNLKRPSKLTVSTKVVVMEKDTLERKNFKTMNPPTILLVDRDKGSSLSLIDEDKHLATYTMNPDEQEITIYVSTYSKDYLNLLDMARHDQRGNPSDEVIQDRFKKLVEEYQYLVAQQSILHYIATEEMSPELSEEDAKMTSYENRIKGAVSAGMGLIFTNLKHFLKE